MKPIRILLAAVAILAMSACSHKAEEGDAASSDEAAAPGDLPDGDATASADAAAAIAAAMAASPTATDMPSTVPSGAASSQAASQSANVPPPVTAH
jgi:hypothetical protein